MKIAIGRWKDVETIWRKTTKLPSTGIIVLNGNTMHKSEKQSDKKVIWQKRWKMKMTSRQTGSWKDTLPSSCLSLDHDWIRKPARRRFAWLEKFQNTISVCRRKCLITNELS